MDEEVGGEYTVSLMLVFEADSAQEAAEQFRRWAQDSRTVVTVVSPDGRQTEE